MYSETCQNLTLHNTESCTNRTKNKDPISEIPLNCTCTNQTEHMNRKRWSQRGSVLTGFTVCVNSLIDWTSCKSLETYKKKWIPTIQLKFRHFIILKMTHWFTTTLTKQTCLHTYVCSISDLDDNYINTPSFATRTDERLAHLTKNMLIFFFSNNLLYKFQSG